MLRVISIIAATAVISLSANFSSAEANAVNANDKNNFDQYTYKCWSVFVNKSKQHKGCFMVASPMAKSGNYKKSGDSYLWVRYIGKKMDEVSLTTGFPFPDDGMAEVRISKDKNCFKNPSVRACENIGGKCKQPNNCFTKHCSTILDDAKNGKCDKYINHGDRTSKSRYYKFDIVEDEQAWVRDAEMDTSLVEDMMSGHYAVISAKSKKGSCATNIYSLMGFTEAYKKMKSNCEK